MQRRIAVIGRGTAGSLAVAILQREHPNVGILHIYDPETPILGVGEGTILGASERIQELVGLSGDPFLEALGATRKFGIKFEGWGRSGDFIHHFYPRGRAYAHHLPAPRLAERLQASGRATQVPHRVAGVESTERAATVHLTNGESFAVDFVVDASGFPRDGRAERHRLVGLPARAACLRHVQGPGLSSVVRGTRGGGEHAYDSLTRAVARPHGWVFVIPLRDRISCGYIHDDTLEAARIEADFARFLAEQGWDGEASPPRHLRFPAFADPEPFDGVVLRIGNAASFVEPLEATSIELTWQQIAVFCLLVQRTRPSRPSDPRIALDSSSVRQVNRTLHRLARQIALFVSWHYAAESIYDTPFWKQAAAGFRRAYDAAPPLTQLSFDHLLEVARQGPHPTRDGGRAFDAACEEDPAVGFGIWAEQSFAELGTGLGLLDPAGGQDDVAPEA